LKIESFINPRDHSQNHTRVSMEKNPNKKKKLIKKKILKILFKIKNQTTPIMASVVDQWNSLT
jgi:hypothetical protein